MSRTAETEGSPETQCEPPTDGSASPCSVASPCSRDSMVSVSSCTTLNGRTLDLTLPARRAPAHNGRVVRGQRGVRRAMRTHTWTAPSSPAVVIVADGARRRRKTTAPARPTQDLQVKPSKLGFRAHKRRNSKRKRKEIQCRPPHADSDATEQMSADRSETEDANDAASHAQSELYLSDIEEILESGDRKGALARAPDLVPTDVVPSPKHVIGLPELVPTEIVPDVPPSWVAPPLPSAPQPPPPPEWAPGPWPTPQGEVLELLKELRAEAQGLAPGDYWLEEVETWDIQALREDVAQQRLEARRTEPGSRCQPKRLSEELADRAVEVASRTAGNSMAKIEHALRSGMLCEVSNASSRPEMNGMRCVLLSWNADRRRWKVRLPDGSKKLLRATNIRELGAPSCRFPIATKSEAVPDPVWNSCSWGPDSYAACGTVDDARHETPDLPKADTDASPDGSLPACTQDPYLIEDFEHPLAGCSGEQADVEATRSALLDRLTSAHTSLAVAPTPASVPQPRLGLRRLLAGQE